MRRFTALIAVMFASLIAYGAAQAVAPAATTAAPVTTLDTPWGDH
jgi:hypothetical protein